MTRRLTRLAVVLAGSAVLTAGCGAETPNATAPSTAITAAPIDEDTGSSAAVASDGEAEATVVPDDASATEDDPEPSGEDKTEPDETNVSGEATEDPGPTAAGATTSREPTDSDRARFVAQHQPEGAVDLEHVAFDLDGDNIQELVFAYVRSGPRLSHLDVAWWTGDAYEIRYSADGGAADEVRDLRVADINDDGRVEVVITQQAGTAGASATLWAAVGGPSMQALVARGGCHDGSATYGVVGVSFRDDDRDGAEEVHATCDDSPLPPSAWSSDVYVWSDGAYRHLPGA